MSTLSQALTNPLVVIILAIGAFGGCQWLWKQFQAWRLANDQKAYMANAAINHLAEAINQAVIQLVDSIRKHDVRMESVEQLLIDAIAASDKLAKDAAATSEKLLAGSLKACEAIATETAQHRASVEAFSKNLFGQERDKALEMPTEIDKDRVYREMEWRAAGKTDSEARDLAEQDIAHTEAIYPSA